MPHALDTMHPLLYPEESAGQALPGTSGWWLIVLLAIILPSLLLLWKRHKNTKPAAQPSVTEPASQLDEALTQLEQLQPPAPEQQAGPWLQQLNLLLKRFCAVRYPDVATHRLSGREWLAFLDSRCPAAGLTRWMILVQGSYLPDCRLSARDSQALHQAIALWMRSHV